MKVFFARRTFSEPILKWWLNFQQGRVEKGGVPSSTWEGMKEVLQRRFDPTIKKSVVASTANFSPYKEDKKKYSAVDVMVKKPASPSAEFTSTYEAAYKEWKNSCLAINLKINDMIQMLAPKKAVTTDNFSSKKCMKEDEEKKESLVLHDDCLIEPQNNVVDDASNCLSMMAQEVQSDGITVNVKGQHSSIFQTKCKIQDKVCKLIIDGGSFTNAISSDLVHTLSLSMRRLPTPRYMQWMNQSGTLKITHKVRVKFSIGEYIDSVDCDVAPMSACHLLLGRPWQFDVDATHGGHSNIYSFVHKGIHFELKPMLESAIKVEVFPTVKKKTTQLAEISPKPRTALPREGENDVDVPNPVVIGSAMGVPVVVAHVTEDVKVMASCICHIGRKVSEVAAGNSLEASHLSVCDDKLKVDNKKEVTAHMPCTTLNEEVGPELENFPECVGNYSSIVSEGVNKSCGQSHSIYSYVKQKKMMTGEGLAPAKVPEIISITDEAHQTISTGRG